MAYFKRAEFWHRTGFIFEHKWKCPRTGAELTGMFLVTNKHVIVDANGGKFRFTLSTLGDSAPKLEKWVEVNVERRRTDGVSPRFGGGSGLKRIDECSWRISETSP